MITRRSADPVRVSRAVDALALPEAVFKTCPYVPRDLVATGLRQWLRCAGAALADGQTIGMPSYAVDEAWHGLILCTRLYAGFCDRANGRFLHHDPDGAGRPEADPDARLGRTVVAWAKVARPGEECVLWDLDARVGVAQPWGVRPEKVAAVLAALAAG